MYSSLGVQSGTQCRAVLLCWALLAFCCSFSVERVVWLSKPQG